MRLRLIITLFITLIFAPFTFGQNLYKYTLDLKNVIDDRVKVTMECPEIYEEKAVFVIPRVIPGSYAYKEYGRYITNLKGFDSVGNEIKISKKKNIFYIKKDARKLKKIEYWVDDTWDDSTTKSFIFQPGGSNTEYGKNYLINHFAFEGYFEGYKSLPFEITIIKPAYFSGFSWLKTERVNLNQDIIYAASYDELADNPVMYCIADTASFVIDSTRIIVSSYSSTQDLHADSIATWLKPLATSLKSFMGKIPVSEYYFTFYFATEEQLVETKSKGLSGFGALEHNHGSVYFLPEMGNGEEARLMVQDIAAHEFLHILTPLNLRSEEIADFNFKDPKMSQHLWLYEGVTEYFSWLVRVQNGLVSEKDFIDEFRKKLNRADSYGLFSFTEMSSNVLKPMWQEKYTDVYQKGAVMAMLLDQELLFRSGGKYGLKHLISDLIYKYGQDKPFKDDSLFTDIVNLSFPGVKDFIGKYIQGAEILPLSNSMSSFGYTYTAAKVLEVFYVGSFSFRLNEDEVIEIGEVQSSPGGLKPGDLITKVNGTKVNRGNFGEFVDKYFKFNTEYEQLNLDIIRDGKEISVTANTVKGYGLKKHDMEKNPTMFEEDEILLRAWLKGEYVD